MKLSFKSLLVSTLCFSLSFAVLAKVPPEKEEEVKAREKARSGNAMGTRVGKKVIAAFDLYNIDKDEEGNPVDNTEEAIAILLDVDPKKDFDKAMVNRYIGGMYATVDGKAEEAIKYLKIAEELDALAFKDQAEVIKNLGALHMQERKFEEAIAYNKKYLEFSLDEDPKTYLSIANAYYELKQYDKVLAPARKSIEYFAKWDKPNQNPYILVMASFYERKMYKEATGALEDLVKVFPEEPKWWVQLGGFYALIEDYKRALSTMDVAYKNGYFEKDTHYKQLAQLYANNGVPYKSAIIQEKYMQEGILKKDDKSLSIMATTFQNAKEYAKAAKYFEEAANLANDAGLYRKQANALMILERHQEALNAFKKAMDIEPKNKGQIWLGIGETNFHLENWQAAYDAFREAEKISTTARTARGWLGYVKDTARRKGVNL
jgi:tetratricopeptide (TPR) repeat protein